MILAWALEAYSQEEQELLGAKTDWRTGGHNLAREAIYNTQLCQNLPYLPHIGLDPIFSSLETSIGQVQSLKHYMVMVNAFLKMFTMPFVNKKMG